MMEGNLPEDLANLSELDEKSLLEVLTGRFTQNLIYVSKPAVFLEIIKQRALVLWESCCSCFISLRYITEFIFLQTYIGDILVAINPFKYLSIYEKAVRVCSFSYKEVS